MSWRKRKEMSETMRKFKGRKCACGWIDFPQESCQGKENHSSALIACKFSIKSHIHKSSIDMIFLDGSSQTKIQCFWKILLKLFWYFIITIQTSSSHSFSHLKYIKIFFCVHFWTPKCSQHKQTTTCIKRQLTRKA